MIAYDGASKITSSSEQALPSPCSVGPTVTSGRSATKPEPASGLGAAAKVTNYSNASYTVSSNNPASSVGSRYSNAPFANLSNPSPYRASPSPAPSGLGSGFSSKPSSSEQYTWNASNRTSAYRGTQQFNATTFPRPSSSALRSDQHSSLSPPDDSSDTKMGHSKDTKCGVSLANQSAPSTLSTVLVYNNSDCLGYLTSHPCLDVRRFNEINFVFNPL